MSEKHDLTLADFEAHPIWTWDEDADDGSMIPVNKIPFCHNGDIDLDALCVLSQCTSSKDQQWPAIIGIRGSEFSVYWIRVFTETGNCEWNLNLSVDPTDVVSFKKAFGDNPGRVFPLVIETHIASLNQTVAAEIPPPF